MVDFAIVLEPSPTTIAGFSENLDPLDPTHGVASFNQTTDHIVSNRPLAVNIESKSHTGDFDKAFLQLSIWISAQYKRLSLLAETAGHKAKEMQLPPLPLLIAHGARWTLGFATHHNGETVRIYSCDCQIEDCR